MEIDLGPKITGTTRREVRTGTGESVHIKPRTFVVRKFRPGEFGSEFGERGVFDGDELLGLADLRPDGEEQEKKNALVGELSEFQRLGERAPAGTAQRLLDETIAMRMSEYGESRQLAERGVVQTSVGLLLWERARKDRMVYD